MREPAAAEFGRNVRAVREIRDLSQLEVAARMSALGFQMHQTKVSKIEAGTRPTSIPELVGLVIVLGTRYSTLLPEIDRDLWAVPDE